MRVQAGQQFETGLTAGGQRVTGATDRPFHGGEGCDNKTERSPLITLCNVRSERFVLRFSLSEYVVFFVFLTLLSSLMDVFMCLLFFFLPPGSISSTAFHFVRLSPM